jgi:glycosyltransferase involved in cell wall biosynthesis
MRHYARMNALAAEIDRQIRDHRIDFVYERSAYLSFAALRAAKRRNIPHFYEVNGLSYLDFASYYRSALNPTARRMELGSFRESDHVFFVGDNWSRVQNGVETEFVAQFAEPRRTPALPLRICFIGHVMQHHKVETLLDAFRAVRRRADVEFHVIGTFPASLAEALREFVPVTLHGVLPRDAMASVLADCHVGLVSGDMAFGSFMKLFDYGAARPNCCSPGTAAARRWARRSIASSRRPSWCRLSATGCTTVSPATSPGERYSTSLPTRSFAPALRRARRDERSDAPAVRPC